MKIAASNVVMNSDRTFKEINAKSYTQGISFQNNLLNESRIRGLKDSLEMSDDSYLSSNFTYTGLDRAQTDTSVKNNAQDVLDEIRQIRVNLLTLILGMFQNMSRSAKYTNTTSSLISSINNSSKIFAYESFSNMHLEKEQTSFSAKGIAYTEDGREIDFGVDIAMSRTYASYANITVAREVNLLDPLVINVGNNITDITDQSFYFDLDADGDKEFVSNIGSGSGFLSYDKNGDGIINDGSELFGALSGNGFSDLAGYDKDGNGWIDENDDIYNKLRVWYKDKNGDDVLMTLKDADVGAIYLGHAATEFTEQGSDFSVNGVIRQSGIYLKESGGSGIVQQIDLAEKGNKSENNKTEITDEMLNKLYF